MKLDCNRFASVWEFREDTLQIEVIVRKVRSEKGGDVIVEIEPLYGPKGKAEPLAAPHRSNLSTPRTKTEWANAMSRRWTIPENFGVTWSDIIERVAGRVIADHRRGSPFVRLSEVQAPPATEWQIPGLLPLDETTLVYGDGGSGKSLFAVYATVIVASGRPFLGGVPATRPGQVLYLDWETTPAGLRRRLARVADGEGIPVPDNVWYRHCQRPLLEEIEELASESDAMGAELVVVDSLGWALGGDPNDTQRAIETMSALREFRTTVLVIAHPPKGEMKSDEERTVSGSGFFRYGARAMWELRQSEGQSDSEIRIQLYNRKMNEDKPEKMPLVIDVTFLANDARGVILLPAGQIGLRDLDGLGTKERVRYALGKATAPVAISEIVAYLKANSSAPPPSEGSIRQTLARMPDAVNVAASGQGKWLLRSRQFTPKTAKPTSPETPPDPGPEPPPEEEGGEPT